jgi:hypothetical protein
MDERMYDSKDPYSAAVRARPGNADLSDESYCHRFLGSFSIPFSVLYMSGGRISGWFEVDVPKVVLGYDFVEESKKPGSSSSNDDVKEIRQRGSMYKTMVQVLITLQPPIAIPPGVFRVAQSDSHLRAPHRVRVARRRAEKWYRRLAAMKRTQGRTIDPLVPNLHARLTLITRYIRALKPPPMPKLGDSFKAKSYMSEISHISSFTSLIPFVNDWTIDTSNAEMWCTSTEFLHLLAGDWEVR